jgi:hypothetical protein
MSWDESKHPRVNAGDSEGGQFTDGSVAASAARKAAGLNYERKGLVFGYPAVISNDSCCLNYAMKVSFGKDLGITGTTKDGMLDIPSILGGGIFPSLTSETPKALVDRLYKTGGHYGVVVSIKNSYDQHIFTLKNRIIYNTDIYKTSQYDKVLNYFDYDILK